jgi:hypothetical protein
VLWLPVCAAAEGEKFHRLIVRLAASPMGRCRRTYSRTQGRYNNTTTRPSLPLQPLPLTQARQADRHRDPELPQLGVRRSPTIELLIERPRDHWCSEVLCSSEASALTLVTGRTRATQLWVSTTSLDTQTEIAERDHWHRGQHPEPPFLLYIYYIYCPSPTSLVPRPRPRKVPEKSPGSPQKPHVLSAILPPASCSLHALPSSVRSSGRLIAGRFCFVILLERRPISWGVLAGEIQRPPHHVRALGRRPAPP